MRRAELAALLDGLEGFDAASPELEQYETPGELASRILHLAALEGDLGRVVDLGCGTGVLAVGAAALGASVVGVDVDRAALEVAGDNADVAGVEVGWIRADVRRSPLDVEGVTVVMNPPFGAQRRGADRPFLDLAADIADVVYTVHNSGSLDFVDSYVEGEITHAFEAEISLPRRFGFHEHDERALDVEVYRIETSEAGA